MTALNLTVPIFTTLLAFVFLKEKLKKHRILALFVGFFGAIAANLAAFFVRKDEDEKIDKLQRDINAINEKLDKLAKK